MCYLETGGPVRDYQEFPQVNFIDNEIGKYRVVCVLPRTIVCICSFYIKAPEDGPMRSEACRAET